MSPFRDLAAAVASALTLERASRGRVRLLWRGSLAGLAYPADQQPELEQALTDLLYDRFYVHGRVVPQPPPIADGDHDSGSLESQLIEAAASACAERRLPGWRLVQTLPNGDAVAAQDRLALRLPPLASPHQPGQFLDIPGPAATARFMPGFCQIYSSAPMNAGGSTARFYWNTSVPGAIRFTAEAARRFHQAGIPFQAKSLSSASAYYRTDSTVLYLDANHLDRAWPIIAAIHHEIAPLLQEGVPAFTLRLAHGLGFAEDPGNGESFGQHRCRLMAAGFLQAFHSRRRSIPRRVAAVLDQFQRAGILPQAPHLSQSSSLPATLPPLSGADGSSGTVPSSPLSPPLPSYTGCAIQIAQQLCDAALWHEDRCTLVTTQDHGDPSRRNLFVVTLPADLYAGAAGVALFLARLAVLEGNPAAPTHRTALGLMRQALDLVDRDVPKADPFDPRIFHAGGFYSGALSACVGVLEAAVALGEESLATAALTRIRHLGGIAAAQAASFSPRLSWDLLDGAAGACCALLRAAGHAAAVGHNECIPFAAQIARGLLLPRAGPANWRFSAASGGRALPLTGFAHGAAGAAYALCKLAARTADPAFLQAAATAIAWEQSQFRTAEANWPDFRGVTSRRHSHLAPCATHWCHGGPGIALSRAEALRAGLPAALDFDHAAATAVRSLEADIRAGFVHGALCHGGLSNAEILGTLPDSQHQERYSLLRRDAAEAVADQVFRRHQPWPCDHPGSPQPSLMQGLAGIGYYFLRLQHPEIPSPLTP